MIKVKAKGVLHSEDRTEFLNAIDYLQEKGIYNIEVRENVRGTAIAFGNIIKIAVDRELVNHMVDLFYQYNCEFYAEWNDDPLLRDYYANIDFTKMPISVSRMIIKMNKILIKKKKFDDKQDAKFKALEEKEKNKKAIKKLKASFKKYR